MAKVITLHQSDALTLPLADGAALRVTAFCETPRVAITLSGPGGGNAGGVILNARHARLLGSWLQKLAERAGADAGRPQRVRGRRAHAR